MSAIFNKAHMNVLMNVRSIIIQIQQIGRLITEIIMIF